MSAGPISISMEVGRVCCAGSYFAIAVSVRMRRFVRMATPQNFMTLKEGRKFMSIYLCSAGHKQRTQDAAVNCGYCRRNARSGNQLMILREKAERMNKKEPAQFYVYPMINFKRYTCDGCMMQACDKLNSSRCCSCSRMYSDNYSNRYYSQSE